MNNKTSHMTTTTLTTTLISATLISATLISATPADAKPAQTNNPNTNTAATHQLSATANISNKTRSLTTKNKKKKRKLANTGCEENLNTAEGWQTSLEKQANKTEGFRGADGWFNTPGPNNSHIYFLGDTGIGNNKNGVTDMYRNTIMKYDPDNPTCWTLTPTPFDPPKNKPNQWYWPTNPMKTENNTTLLGLLWL